MEGKLVLGKVVVADKVAEAMKEDKQLYNFVCTSLGKYMKLDWGETPEEDKARNDENLENGGSIRALYQRGNKEKIFIETDKNGQFTTIDFN